MISTGPLLRLMAEKGIDVKQLSQLTGIPLKKLSTLRHNSRHFNVTQLDEICKVLGVQPYEVVEFVKTEKKGHWEWIDDIS